MLGIFRSSRVPLSVLFGTGLLLSSGSARAIEPSSTLIAQSHDRPNLIAQDPSVSQFDQKTEAQVNALTGQVSSVSQLSDVRPTDWAFQALQSLVERYGCIAGYPDRTYRGNRALTRYEFAAGLNACLNRVNELIAASTSDLVKKEDLATIQRLQEQFAGELAGLRGRVDSLEARTTTLQKQQFSATTKLRGDLIAIALDTFGDRATNTTARVGDQTQTILGYRYRLTLQSSFTGRDQLTTSIGAANFPILQNATGTAETRINLETYAPRFTDGSVFLDQLFYRFLVGQATFWVGARQLQPAVIAPNLNPLIGGFNGAVSRFATHNPVIYRPGFDGAGAGLTYEFNKRLRLSLGYITDDTKANNPVAGQGLFSGNNEALGQITFSPSSAFDISFAYARKYFDSNSGFNLTGGTGSATARNPFLQNATVSDNFGLHFLWKTTPTFQIGGWFGYTRAHQVRGADNDATILNGALTFAFPDFFRKGDLAGIIVGIPPKTTSNTFRATPSSARRQDPDTSFHLEAFYSYRINDNLTVSPNVYVILNPEHNSVNNTIWVGAVRTYFSF
ncbi:carbohydrate porin [Cyanobacteria bacterium FACHB-63]|nr:carbohydrate porin [Cyanobacteria bacterium FACHB-63]